MGTRGVAEAVECYLASMKPLVQTLVHQKKKGGEKMGKIVSLVMLFTPQEKDDNTKCTLKMTKQTNKFIQLYRSSFCT
jgi:hypothetical protein